MSLALILLAALTPMLEAVHLTCRRGERTLFTDLSFTLSPGELLQIAGANGSGKTSLLRILSGLSAALDGEIHWNNARAHGANYFRDLLYIGHHSAVKEDLSPFENLLIANAFSDTNISPENAIEALYNIGLRGREHLPTKVLSQGQKRRVGLARLLVSNAPLWILDEPLTALDVGAVDLIQARLAEHVQRGGMIVLTTHQALQVPGVTPRRIELSA